MACLYLTEEDVQQLLDMPTAIGAMREVFVQLGLGRAQNVPRTRAQANGITLHSMSAAAADYLGLVGWKQYTTTRQAARFHVGLCDQDSGQLSALIAADRLGQMRTGAVTGLAVDLLAARDAGQLGLFGSGWQAESQLEAVASVRSIHRAIVFSRDPIRRQAFCQRMSDRLQIDVRAAQSPRDVLIGSPIVVTATTSKTPVLDGKLLEAGTIVCAVGSNWLHKAEIDVATLERAERIVCDSVNCCRQEAGDFVAAFERGIFDWSQAVDLKNIVTGELEPVHDVQIFKSVGMAIEDVALGTELIARARKQGLGREIPVN